MEPLQLLPFPLGMVRVIRGFFGPMVDGSYWLLIINDYSRYLFVKEVSTTSADVNIPVIRCEYTSH